jgi:N-acetylglucosamine kinase-like BadF-type ATPase
MTDIELACRAAFAPGRGIVLVAGTGSVAAHLDATVTLQRAGGRGVLIDDAGGGHWIATRALRAVWRAEDEQPGAGRDSALGRALFEAVGGPDWAATRAAVYGAQRGAVGALAAAVGAAAHAGDATALALLRRAGAELARPVRALLARVGPQPVALAGRVFDLHPAVEAALREALAAAAPAAAEVRRLPLAPHVTAAVLAAGGVPATFS